MRARLSIAWIATLLAGWGQLFVDAHAVPAKDRHRLPGAGGDGHATACLRDSLPRRAGPHAPGAAGRSAAPRVEQPGHGVGDGRARQAREGQLCLSRAARRRVLVRDPHGRHPGYHAPRRAVATAIEGRGRYRGPAARADGHARCGRRDRRALAGRRSPSQAQQLQARISVQPGRALGKRGGRGPARRHASHLDRRSHLVAQECRRPRDRARRNHRHGRQSGRQPGGGSSQPARTTAHRRTVAWQAVRVARVR